MSQLLSRVFCSMFDPHFVPVVTLTTRRRCCRSNLQVDTYVWWTESNRKSVTEAAVTMTTTGVIRGGKQLHWRHLCSNRWIISHESLLRSVSSEFLLQPQNKNHGYQATAASPSQPMTQRRNPPEPKQASCWPSLWSCSCRDAVSMATCLEHCSLRNCSGSRCQSVDTHRVRSVFILIIIYYANKLVQISNVQIQTFQNKSTKMSEKGLQRSIKEESEWHRLHHTCKHDMSTRRRRWPHTDFMTVVW